MKKSNANSNRDVNIMMAMQMKEKRDIYHQNKGRNACRSLDRTKNFDFIPTIWLQSCESFVDAYICVCVRECVNPQILTKITSHSVIIVNCANILVENFNSIIAIIGHLIAANAALLHSHLHTATLSYSHIETSTCTSSHIAKLRFNLFYFSTSFDEAH